MAEDTPEVESELLGEDVSVEVLWPRMESTGCPMDEAESLKSAAENIGTSIIV